MAVKQAIFAGAIATGVMSAGLVAQQTLAATRPGLDLIGLVQGLTDGPRLYGWFVHVAIGTLIGGPVFALCRRLLPGRGGPIKGLAFGVWAWAMMMLVFLPLVGGGFFGLVMGWRAPAIALVLQLIYGATLGLLYRPRY